MTNKELWQIALGDIELSISKANFITWFKNTCILDIKDGQVTLGVPNGFAKEWLENKYNLYILRALRNIQPEVREVLCAIVTNISTNLNRKPTIDAIIPVKKIDKYEKTVQINQENNLNSKYIFENFIVGGNNELARAACFAVSQNIGRSYNPLFIYGGVGLGKTHLLQATGNEILMRDSDKVVVYITSERFTNEIIEAIGKRNSKSFKDRYRKVDCLIIDDIQFLANKEMTQQEFFHTFNELYDNNKQIIISSDRPPKDLSILEDRLVSRFEMGMIVDVSLPDYETRLAILHSKCREYQVLIHPEVLEFIALNVQQSIRELEGLLLQAIAEAQLEKSTPTVRSVAKILKKHGKDSEVKGYESFSSAPASRPTSAKEVIELVARYYKLDAGDILGESRKRTVMMPRQMAMYLIRHELNFPYEQIGEDFGGKNHTTVMHACEKVISRLKKDQHLLRDVNSIKKEMGL